MKRVDIRLAVSADLPALCKLYHAFHEFHVAGVPDRLRSLGPFEEYDTTQLMRRLKEILNNQKACLFVAEVEGLLVGFAEVYLREDEPDQARVSCVYGHLQSLMVDAAWRKQGIGGRLIREVEIWIIQKDAYEIRLDTWSFPGDPVQFYEKLGYHTLSQKLVRRLKPANA